MPVRIWTPPLSSYICRYEASNTKLLSLVCVRHIADCSVVPLIPVRDYVFMLVSPVNCFSKFHIVFSYNWELFQRKIHSPSTLLTVLWFPIKLLLLAIPLI